MNELLDGEYHSQMQEFLLGLADRRGMQNAAYPKLAHLLRTVASIGRVDGVQHRTSVTKVHSEDTGVDGQTTSGLSARHESKIN